jgi:hypothetical protein
MVLWHNPGFADDVKSDLNLRDTFECRRNTNEVEVAKEFVVPYELTSTLIDLDFDGGLTISSCREDLRLLGGNSSVRSDKFCHDTAESFNT